MKGKTQKGNKSKAASANVVAVDKSSSFKKYYYLLGLLTFFLFANSIGNDYNLDDNLVTRGNELTSQGFSAIKEIFTSNYYSDAMGYAFGYRPIVHLSFAIENRLFGEKPGVGHFINVLLFAFSVVLFFKLIVKWVGEKNILFAGIVAVLFAVHPIHTEVVDSLKNRDELLAFLFVIWSGLAMHKFIEKGKLWSLFSIVLLFTIAMLSKKSVYPMAIVLPAALILLKNVTYKQAVFITLSFVIPAAIIGSELNLSRMGIMITLPLIAIGMLFFIKSRYLIDEVNSEKVSELKKIIPPATLILVGALVAFATNSSIILFATLPFFVWLFRVQFHFGLVLMICLIIGLDIFWLMDRELQFVSLLLGLGYGLYNYLKTKKFNLFWTGIALVSIVYFFLQNNGLSSLVNVTWICVFILLTNYRGWFGLIAGVVTLGIIFHFKSEIHISAVTMILISSFWIIYTKTKEKIWIHLLVGIVYGLSLGYVANSEYNSPNKEVKELIAVAKPEKKEFIKNENILKEGRELVYVENTLIEPHSKGEVVGTGFATLGEYFRLMAFPYELSFYYGFAKTDTSSLSSPWVWVIILVHLGMLVLAFFHLKKNPLITIGVFWYLLSILLFSNWVELVAGMVGERLAFTASAGFCIFVTGILFWIKPDLNFKKPGLVGFVLIGVLVLFAGRTMTRNRDWKNTLTLMGNDIKHLSNSSQANNMYAMNLMAETNINKTLTQQEILEMRKLAVYHFREAVRIYPDYFNVYIDMARVALMTGEYQVGLDAVEKAIELDPENQYSYYFSLSLLEKTGDYETYLKHAQILFDLAENQESYGGLSRGYFLLKEYQKSKDVLLDGLSKYPDNEGLKYNLKFVEETMKNL